MIGVRTVKAMKFARYVFYIAGIYGLLALVPQFFLSVLEFF